MKFTLTFKTPDVLDQITEEQGAATEEEYALADLTANRFLRHGEYLEVEFDTERQTATVKEK